MSSRSNGVTYWVFRSVMSSRVISSPSVSSALTCSCVMPEFGCSRNRRSTSRDTWRALAPALPNSAKNSEARGTLTKWRCCGRGRLRERFYDQRLEVRDELLGLRQQPPFFDEPGPHAGLHAFDEHAILGADLRVERKRLLDPRLVGVLRDE